MKFIFEVDVSSLQGKLMDIIKQEIAKQSETDLVQSEHTIEIKLQGKGPPDPDKPKDAA